MGCRWYGTVSLCDSSPLCPMGSHSRLGGRHDALIDGAEDAVSAFIEHLDAYSIAELEEWGQGPAVLELLEHTSLDDAG